MFNVKTYSKMEKETKDLEQIKTFAETFGINREIATHIRLRALKSIKESLSNLNDDELFRLYSLIKEGGRI